MVEDVVGLARVVHVSQIGLSTNKRFDYQIVKLLLQQLYVVAALLQVCSSATQRPFVALKVLILVDIKDELLMVFVDRVIGQMHVCVGQVFPIWRKVFFSRESADSFFVDKNPHGITAREQHVNPQVALQTFDQKGFVDVALRHYAAFTCDVFDVPCQKYSASLARCFWLYNERFFSFLIELHLKVASLRRQQPRLREEVVRFWETLLQLLQLAP